MLKLCSVCKNRKMDIKRVLVCSLTDDYADFDPVCENYVQDNCHSEKEDMRTKEDSQLTLDKIMDCIRKVGYYPQKRDENTIAFEIDGDEFIIQYKNLSFQLFTRYSFNFDEEVRTLVEKAAFLVMYKIMLIRILIVIEDGSPVLLYSIESYEESFSQFEKFLPTYIAIIIDSIDIHREKFQELLQEYKSKTESIYFPKNFNFD